MIAIRKVESPADLPIDDLTTVLIDSVEHGASVGFLSPLGRAEAAEYWRQVAGQIGKSLHLWVALADGRAVGTVQIAVCEKANGRHRAELQKLLVHSGFRGNHLATRLMDAAESHAGLIGLRLLVLDTHAGSLAESVYQRRGWRKAGEIPEYAGLPNGELIATALYYKLLDQPEATA